MAQEIANDSRIDAERYARNLSRIQWIILTIDHEIEEAVHSRRGKAIGWKSVAAGNRRRGWCDKEHCASYKRPYNQNSFWVSWFLVFAPTHSPSVSFASICESMPSTPLVTWLDISAYRGCWRILSPCRALRTECTEIFKYIPKMVREDRGV